MPYHLNWKLDVVKWFKSTQKDLDFISAEGVDTDIFAHYSAIEMVVTVH